jgi:pyruvate ferredoxin oxidoreductase gamma subunit
MLAVAAFAGGHYAQAFPSFGSERTGAPVVSFCRMADEEIRLREPVMQPDALIVQDPTLLHQVDVFSGLDPDGYMLINTSRSFAELGLQDFVTKFRQERLLTVPATEIAMATLGRPMPGAVLLGGFAALTQQVTLEAVIDAIKERFSGRVAAGNSEGAKQAYDLVVREMEELAHAQAD